MDTNVNVKRRNQEALTSYKNTLFMGQLVCDHKNRKGADVKLLNKDMPKGTATGFEYPENTVECQTCGARFCMTTFSDSDLEGLMFNLRSIFAQEKILAGFTDDEYDIICNDEQEMLDILGRHFGVYRGMRQNFENNGSKKKQQTSKNRKGSMSGGISVSSFR